jgi:two-component system, LytTR family, response regulator
MKAFIIDDEENNISNLKFLLQHDCEGVNVVGTYTRADTARQALNYLQPDVVFLDINMPEETGFQFLEKLPERNFQVVFVTAYSDYALQAIKASAVDYILKPVRIDDLQEAVQKAKQRMADKEDRPASQVLINQLLQTVKSGNMPSKIALPQLGGYTFLDIDEIITLQADSNYTIVHKKNMQKVVVSRTLREFEELLTDGKFLRIHKSHIINLTCVNEYSTTDGGTVKMDDGSVWSISRRQLDTFLQQMKTFSRKFH